MSKHDFFTRNRRKEKKKRELRETFLIVCEGERTEPNYFKKFPIRKEVAIVDVVGEGKNTNTLVMSAIEMKKTAQNQGNPYVQVWVVFDRDSFPANNFQRAINLCQVHSINYAVTNEAFELWYLLHFNYYDSAMSRIQYGDKLSEQFGRKYMKNHVDIYELLRDKQEQAIKSAIKLSKHHFELNGCHDHCNSNPITTVHELVEILNEYIEKD